ncbi:MAG: hypothetical protein R3B84_00555 [Zavarzinella sp.]
MRRNNRLFLVLLLFSIPTVGWVQEKQENEKQKPLNTQMPTFRVDAEGFNAPEENIKALCSSAGITIWQYCTDVEADKFVVIRGRKGPYFSHIKNDRKELVIQLDTEGTYWSQYAYQFAHEFCHLLCGHANKDPRLLWFEETLAETASLFAMRRMAQTWEKKPPYSNWKEYRHSLRQYTDRVMLTRTEQFELYELGLGKYFQKHQAELLKVATNRERNGAMAQVLLPLFENQPEQWQALHWLNKTPIDPKETFEQHLGTWHKTAPMKHRPFIAKIAKMYGYPLEEK